MIVEFDNKRPGLEQERDMLRLPLYSCLCRAALGGHLRSAVGGANCRTWSILRWFPKPGAPSAGTCLSQGDQRDTDNDSILLLRLMVLQALAAYGAHRRRQAPPGTPGGSSGLFHISPQEEMLLYLGSSCVSILVSATGALLD